MIRNGSMISAVVRQPRNSPAPLNSPLPCPNLLAAIPEPLQYSLANEKAGELAQDSHRETRNRGKIP